MTGLETDKLSLHRRVSEDPCPDPNFGTRRRLIRKLGLLGAAVLTGCQFRAPIGSGSRENTLATSVPIPAPIVDDPVCVLTPEATEGPFYFDTDQVRRDIVEDRVGTPLQMSVRVVRVDEKCEPLKDAYVDIWHADAAGTYSGYPDQLGGLDTSGQTFLRGTQLTDVDGIARFDTIYPGWYPGRAVHIHFKVHYQGNSFLTSQFYFPDDVSDRVFEQPPYSERPNRATRNGNDSVLREDPSDGNLLATITGDTAGYSGAITVGVVL
ncbi:MAG: intradiol ring-cleavage dioxygenase [Chloroflexi bacterium]|nr:intradiol ring-cleavage dioxygenase [Chloroflexota bacterium]